MSEAIDWQVEDRVTKQVGDDAWFLGTVKTVKEHSLGILWDHPDLPHITSHSKEEVRRPKTS